MGVLSHDEINKCFLELLKEFDDFCNSNDLKYYLLWGTLLGAVRHKGFIPWDDDVDVCMPREDYEQLINTYNLKNRYPYLLIHFSQQKEVNRRLAFLTDTRIGLRKHGVSSKSKFDCLGIDIFPIDGVCDCSIKQNFHETEISIFQILYAVKTIDLEAPRSFARNIIIKIARAILKPISLKKIVTVCDSLAKKQSYCKTSRVGVYAIKTYGRYMIFNKTDFDRVIQIDFESLKLNIPIGYNNILTIIYGDYMTPPPVEKRKPHNPYDEYYIKGN